MSAVSESPSRTEATLAALLSLAWPVVLARATQSVIGFCDALMVAPLGEAALAAATTGALNTFTLIILPMGTVFIVQSFTAQLRGRGQVADTPRFAWYGLALALLAGVFAGCMAPFVPWLLSLFSFEPAVEGPMGSYMRIRMWSVAVVVGTEALGNWYGGLGHTRPAMFAGIVAMVANLAGNYLLIEPRFGLPGFGVQGAAWASVIGSGLGFLAIAIPWLRGMGYEKPTSAFQWRWREMGRVLRFGLPNGVNWFLEFSAFMIFVNVIVAYLGTTVLAAMSVVIQINSIAFMPAFGLASAGAIFVGEAIGRGAHVEVSRIVRMTGTVCAVWMGAIGLVYWLAPQVLMGWFASDAVTAATLVQVGATMLAISAIWQLFDALGLTLGEALRAAGDTAWCMAARIGIAWLVFMPASFVAVQWLQGGVIAVMVVLAGYVALIAMAFTLRFASGHWRRIQMVGATEPMVGATEPLVGANEPQRS